MSAISRPSRVAAGATDVELFYLMDVLESLGVHQAYYHVGKVQAKTMKKILES